jgi:hypothetical protein
MRDLNTKIYISLVILLLFKYLFYSNTSFILILILLIIQILILFIIQIPTLPIIQILLNIREFEY